MKIFTRTLAAGQETTIGHEGRFIRGVAGAERYQIAIDQGQKTDFETGIAYESPRSFNTVTIKNTATTTQTIEIAIANGYVADNRMVGRVDINGGIKLKGGTSWAVSKPQAGAAAGELLAAADRQSVLLKPTGKIWIGESLANEADWFPVTGPITINGGGAVYAKGDTGAVDVHVIEEFS